jgi:hypothetical protein
VGREDIKGLLSVLVCGGISILLAWSFWTTRISPTTAKEKEQVMRDRGLCRLAAACKTYSEARANCATAGSFKRCLQIKMGDESMYSDVCSGFQEGAVAVPPSAQTPYALTCFLLLNFE